MPPVTACDEPWHFFLFWRHDFWPKLASSILNFCRRKRSFQWCPDQSDRPNGALDMRTNAQKVEWKTQSKISCHYTWLLHAKNCLSRWRFQKSKSIKTSQNFDFCACPNHNALKRDAGGKKGKLLCCKRFFDQIKSNLAEIQPKNHQNVQRMHFLRKVPGVNGLKYSWYLKILSNCTHPKAETCNFEWIFKYHS